MLAERKRFLRIEGKSFDFLVMEDKQKECIKISENGRGIRISLYVEMKEARWLASTVDELRRWRGVNAFIRKYRGVNQTWLLELKKNQRGNFACLSEINKVGRCRFIIIPEGYEGKGWKEFGNIISDLSQKEALGQCLEKGEVGSSQRLAINVPNEVWGVHREEARVTTSVVQLGRGLCIQTRYSSMANNFGVWDRVVVCDLVGKNSKWSEVTKALEKRLGRGNDLRLFPFSSDRAVFFCATEEIASKTGKLGRVLLEGKVDVILHRWSPEVNSFADSISVNRGWIAVKGLPFHLWTREVFNSIGECCGGLISCDRGTVTMDFLEEAILLVKGGEDGFIPSKLEVRDRGVLYPLNIRKLLGTEGSRRDLVLQDTTFKGVGSITSRSYQKEVEEGRLGDDGTRGRRDDQIHSLSVASHRVVSYAQMVEGSKHVGHSPNLNFEFGKKQLVQGGTRSGDIGDGFGPLCDDGPINKNIQGLHSGYGHGYGLSTHDTGQILGPGLQPQLSSIVNHGSSPGLEMQKGLLPEDIENSVGFSQDLRRVNQGENGVKSIKSSGGKQIHSNLKQGCIFGGHEEEMDSDSSSFNQIGRDNDEDGIFSEEEKGNRSPDSIVSMYHMFHKGSGQGELNWQMEGESTAGNQVSFVPDSLKSHDHSADNAQSEVNRGHDQILSHSAKDIGIEPRNGEGARVQIFDSHPVSSDPLQSQGGW